MIGAEPLKGLAVADLLKVYAELGWGDVRDDFKKLKLELKRPAAAAATAAAAAATAAVGASTAPGQPFAATTTAAAAEEDKDAAAAERLKTAAAAAERAESLMAEIHQDDDDNDDDDVGDQESDRAQHDGEERQAQELRGGGGSGRGGGSIDTEIVLDVLDLSPAGSRQRALSTVSSLEGDDSDGSPLGHHDDHLEGRGGGAGGRSSPTGSGSEVSESGPTAAAVARTKRKVWSAGQAEDLAAAGEHDGGTAATGCGNPSGGDSSALLLLLLPAGATAPTPPPPAAASSVSSVSSSIDGTRMRLDSNGRLINLGADTPTGGSAGSASGRRSRANSAVSFRDSSTGGDGRGSVGGGPGSVSSRCVILLRTPSQPRPQNPVPVCLPVYGWLDCC